MAQYTVNDNKSLETLNIDLSPIENNISNLNNRINDIDTLPVYSFDINFSDLSTSWTDTGISNANLPAGIYIVEYWGLCHTNYTWQIENTYAGIMVMYGGGTNATEASEIYLHTAGHAHNGQLVQLRTLQHSGNPTNSTTLQIRVTGGSFSGTAHFRLRRIMSWH